MTATTHCTRCGSQIAYEPSDNPLLANLHPTVCDGCADREAAAMRAEIEAAEHEDRGIPPRYVGASFATFTAHTPSQELALEALRDRAAEGVMLLGAAGCGKTHLACAAIAAAKPRSLFANTTVLLDDLRRGYGGESGADLFARAKDAPLLALDDLGAEAITDWVRDRLYVLINHRWDNCRPLIVTTNVPAADLAERIGQGVASRIAGCCAHRIRVKGPDGRRAS